MALERLQRSEKHRGSGGRAGGLIEPRLPYPWVAAKCDTTFATLPSLRGVWLGCKHGRNGGVDMAGHPGRALKMPEILKMAA
jgi:hypothetical protein